jgi:hypothetical protein
MSRQTALTAILAPVALVASLLVVPDASADPATSGWRHGFCREGEGFTVVIDFNGHSEDQEWDVRCRIGGHSAGYSPITALEAVGHTVTAENSGLVTQVDGVGSDTYSPWWKYVTAEGAVAWDEGSGDYTLPDGDATDWFYGVCLSDDGCTPRIDPQFEPTATVATTGATSATYGTASTVSVTVSSTAGAPRGTVTLRGAGVPRLGTLSAGRARFTLPRTLAVGTHRLFASYDGGATYGTATSTTLTVVVGKRTLPRPQLTVPRQPTTSRRGAVRVAVGTPSGLAQARGTVRIVATQGPKTRRATGRLVAERSTVSLPRLSSGAWRIKATYLGSSTYRAVGSPSRRVVVR